MKKQELSDNKYAPPKTLPTARLGVFEFGEFGVKSRERFLQVSGQGHCAQDLGCKKTILTAQLISNSYSLRR